MSGYDFYFDVIWAVGIVLLLLAARAIWTGKLGADQRSEKGMPPKEWR